MNSKLKFLQNIIHFGSNKFWHWLVNFSNLHNNSPGVPQEFFRARKILSTGFEMEKFNPDYLSPNIIWQIIAAMRSTKIEDRRPTMAST